MRIFRTIVESTSPPEIQSLWIDKGILKYFNNGKWESITGSKDPVIIPSNFTEEQLKVIEEIVYSILHNTTV